MAVEHGRGREQAADIVSRKLGVGQGKDPEQAATEHGIGHGTRGRAVVRDRGEIEVFVQQPGVRLVGGVQHRHSLERNAGAHRVDHPAHDGAHLVVGVGGVPDLGAHGRRDARRDLGRGLDADPPQARDDLRVGRRHARDAGDDLEVGVLRQPAQQTGRRCAPALWEERDERAELGDER